MSIFGRKTTQFSLCKTLLKKSQVKTLSLNVNAIFHKINQVIRQENMKLLSLLIVLILIIQFVNCNNEEIQEEEVVEEEIQKEEIAERFSASTLNRVCRTGFRLDLSGNCRRIFGTKSTQRP